MRIDDGLHFAGFTMILSLIGSGFSPLKSEGWTRLTHTRRSEVLGVSYRLDLRSTYYYYWCSFSIA